MRCCTEAPNYFFTVTTKTNRVMSCHVMSCHAMSCNVMLCHVMPCNARPCHITSCHVMPWHGMSFHVMPCHVMSRNKITCVPGCNMTTLNSEKRKISKNFYFIRMIILKTSPTHLSTVPTHLQVFGVSSNLIMCFEFFLNPNCRCLRFVSFFTITEI